MNTSPPISRVAGSMALLVGFIAVCVGASLTACGGTEPAPEQKGPNVDLVLGGSVVDQDTPAGVVANFEARLANTAVADEFHAPTLERLAIAHVDYADTLGDTPEAAAQREKAVARFGELAETHPDYVGAPAALLMRSYEQKFLGDGEGARASLERLIERYPTVDVAHDGRLALGDLVAREDPALALQLYEAVSHADGGTTERAAYADYQMASVLFSRGDADDAFAKLTALVAGGAASPELLEQVRIVAPMVYTRTEGASIEAASSALQPFAETDADLTALVDVVKQRLGASQ